MTRSALMCSGKGHPLLTILLADFFYCTAFSEYTGALKRIIAMRGSCRAFIPGIVFLISGMVNACKEPPKQPDTPYEGDILISCDESFKPVMDQQVAVYQAQYPG